MTKYNISIEQDPDPQNPRTEWDNLGTMVCFHKRYDLGDEHDYKEDDYYGWDELEEAITKEEDPAVILPIYMLDHSGITVSTQPFSCPWDSGQVGFIFISKEKVLKEYSLGGDTIPDETLETVEKCLRGEVETYDQYLTGDVWGYIIEDEDGEHVDSCWGFYGREYCEKEAQDIRDGMIKQEKEAAIKLKRVQASIPCCRP